MTAPAYIKTGKENALYSLYTGIQNQFTGWTGNLNTSTSGLSVSPLGYNQTMTFPLITIQDVGGPNLGGMALGKQLQEGFMGYEEKTQVEINCYDQNQDGVYMAAEQNVRRLRDLTKDYLENCAQPGSNGVSIYPAIQLVDGNTGTSSQSMVWYERDQPGRWTETYIANTPDMPNVKRYRIYAYIHWFRYITTPSGND